MYTGEQQFHRQAEFISSAGLSRLSNRYLSKVVPPDRVLRENICLVPVFPDCLIDSPNKEAAWDDIYFEVYVLPRLFLSNGLTTIFGCLVSSVLCPSCLLCGEIFQSRTQSQDQQGCM